MNIELSPQHPKPDKDRSDLAQLATLIRQLKQTAPFDSHKRYHLDQQIQTILAVLQSGYRQPVTARKINLLHQQWKQAKATHLQQKSQSQDQNGQNNQAREFDVQEYVDDIQIAIKNEQYEETVRQKKRMEDLLSIMNDSLTLVEEQGQNLELATANISTAHTNVKAGNQQLTKANEQNIKATNKNSIWLLGLGIVTVMIVLFVMLVF